MLPVRYIADPQILEAIAIREGLALAEDLYQRRIHVASECKQVVEDMKKDNASSYGAQIIILWH